MSLARHAKSAVLWNASFNLLREVILRIGGLVIFRRMLETADYGVFDEVNRIVGFLGLFAFTNFVAHTVQVREDKDAQWQNHFTAGGFFQLTLFALTNLIAFALGWFPKFAEFAPLVQLMSLTFLLDWPCEFRRKMLERAFDWKRLRILHASALIVAFLVQLWLARLRCGPYVLLVPSFVMALPFIFDLFVLQGWRPDWTWSWANYKPAWNFGWTRVASGLAFGGRRLIEGSVIVALVGTAQFGILGSALGLAQVACQGFAEQLLYSIYSVLTRVNPDPANVTRVNALVLRVVAWVTIPAAAFSSLLAAPLLLAVYGEKYTAAIPLLPWAMLVGAAIALGNTANQLLLSKNKLKHCLAADILLLVGTLFALVFALPGGLQTYLIAVASLQVVLFALMVVWLIQGQCLNFSGVKNSLLPAFTATGIGVLAVLALEKFGGVNPAQLFFTGTWGAVCGAGLCGVVAGMTYLVVLRAAFTPQLRELAGYLPGGKIARRILILGD
jgi:O-antigen/teichoic acid export membrane protein